MNIKERFLDFVNTGPHESYDYDLSIFELMIYGFVDALMTVLGGLAMLVAFVTIPIWAIPYLIYKKHKIK